MFHFGVVLQLRGRISPFAVSTDPHIRLPTRGSSGELRAGNESGSGLRRQGPPSRQVPKTLQPVILTATLPRACQVEDG